MKPKAKIKFCRFENALAMQVLYMDERFRATIGGCEIFRGSKKSTVVSDFRVESPRINYQPLTIYLRGAFTYGDLNVSVFKLTDIKGCRIKNVTVGIILYLLKDWAQNWEGWKGEPAIEPKITDDFGNKIDLETYTGSVVVVEV